MWKYWDNNDIRYYNNTMLYSALTIAMLISACETWTLREDIKSLIVFETNFLLAIAGEKTSVTESEWLP